MTEHIFGFCEYTLWYIHFNGKREFPPVQFLSQHLNHRLTQVASLASRHEQITVHAAFFLPFTRPLLR
jgi:hypothetical protein